MSLKILDIIRSTNLDNKTELVQSAKAINQAILAYCEQTHNKIQRIAGCGAGCGKFSFIDMPEEDNPHHLIAPLFEDFNMQIEPTRLFLKWTEDVGGLLLYCAITDIDVT